MSIERLKNLLAIQKESCGDQDAYSLGLYNGLLLAIHTIENREGTPSYLSYTLTGFDQKIQEVAALMKARLKANQHKGGWEKMLLSQLMDCLRRANYDFEQASFDAASGKYGEDAQFIAYVGLKMADVQNYAMMMADVVGALKGKDVNGG